MEEKADRAAEAIKSAASSTERDLKLLAEALEENRDCERLLVQSLSRPNNPACSKTCISDPLKNTAANKTSVFRLDVCSLRKMISN